MESELGREPPHCSPPDLSPQRHHPQRRSSIPPGPGATPQAILSPTHRRSEARRVSVLDPPCQTLTTTLASLRTSAPSEAHYGGGTSHQNSPPRSLQCPSRLYPRPPVYRTHSAQPEHSLPRQLLRPVNGLTRPSTIWLHPFWPHSEMSIGTARRSPNFDRFIATIAAVMIQQLDTYKSLRPILPSEAPCRWPTFVA